MRELTYNERGYLTVFGCAVYMLSGGVIYTYGNFSSYLVSYMHAFDKVRIDKLMQNRIQISIIHLLYLVLQIVVVYKKDILY